MVDARKFNGRFYTNQDKEVLLGQETRKDIAHTILAHPKESPSLGEIHYVLGGNKSNLREHLTKMKDNEIVEKLENEDTGMDRPSVFYELTEDSERVMDDDLLEQDRVEEYSGVFEEFSGHWEYSDEQISRYLETQRPE